MKDLWTYLKTATKPIVLYGMGNGADKIISVLNRYDIKISGVFASDGFVRKKVFHGFNVTDYKTAKDTFGDMIVLVCFGSSFYAGAANASTPNAGEVLGILCAATPGAVRSGMEAVLGALERIGFESAGEVPYLAYTVSSCGSFLAKEAGVEEGSALAYLIAPPLESMYAMDAALKAADVKLCKLYAPPSPTNFGGGLLTGTRSACAAACEAFSQAVAEIGGNPK